MAWGHLAQVARHIQHSVQQHSHSNDTLIPVISLFTTTTTISTLCYISPWARGHRSNQSSLAVITMVAYQIGWIHWRKNEEPIKQCDRKQKGAFSSCEHLNKTTPHTIILRGFRGDAPKCEASRARLEVYKSLLAGEVNGEL